MAPGAVGQSRANQAPEVASSSSARPWCEDADPDCDGPLTADHLTPVSRGGARFHFNNLTTRCRFHTLGRGVVTEGSSASRQFARYTFAGL